MMSNSKIKKIAFLLSLIMIFNQIMVVSASSSSSNIMSNDSSNKIDVAIYEASKELDNIPVCIWYKDIDQEAVENEVEMELGYTKEDVTLGLPSIGQKEVADIYELNNNTNNLEQNEILDEYIEENGELISKEKERKDKYVSKRRDIAKEKYREKSKNMVDEFELSDNIRFSSSYAPMVIAELTINEIEELSISPDVLDINYCDPDVEFVDCSTDTYNFDTYIESSGIGDIQENLGLSGNGVLVGMAEGGSIENHTELPSSRFYTIGSTLEDEHATDVARIIAGTKGIARDARVCSISISGEYNNALEENDENISKGIVQRRSFYNTIELLLNQSVGVINISFSVIDNSSSYSDYDKWIDHIAVTHNVTVIVSAGNIRDNNPNGVITSPAKGKNVITVGACNNMGTVATSDDKMFDYSCFDELNTDTSCEKPDIVSGANIGGGGTSSAAPVVTGVVAMILELRPSLALYPEVIKAILMASCQYKAEPYGEDTEETMSQGITEKQGAGVFSPYLAICIAAQGNYQMGTLGSNEDFDDIYFYQPKYGASGMNVSLTWLQNNTFSEVTNSHVALPNIGTANNLNLYLYKNGDFVYSSTKSKSTTEMIYYTQLDSVSNFKCRVVCLEERSEDIRYAFAWCTNNENYQNVKNNEGIYYIKKAFDDYNRYLTYQASTNSYILSLLNTSGNQEFVIQKGTLGNSYKILNGNESSGGIAFEDSLVVVSDNPNDIFLDTSSDRYSYFMTRDVTFYTLDLIDNALVWNKIVVENNNQKWTLEKICYRMGDVNKDGAINATDSNLVLQYSASSIELSNSGKFLADYNGDDSINAQDALAILELASQ